MFSESSPSPLHACISALEQDKKLKASLEEEVKLVSARIQENERHIISAITDMAAQAGADSPDALSVTVGGRKYAVKLSTHYSVPAEHEDLVIEALRQAGYRDAITERINSGRLTAIINETRDGSGNVQEFFRDLPLREYTDAKLSNRKA